MCDHSIRQAFTILTILLFTLISQPGCRSLSNRSNPSPLPISLQQSDSSGNAEWRRARQLDRQGNPASVDHYYTATRQFWQEANELSPGNNRFANSFGQYNACLAELLNAARRYKRLDPSRGLIIHQAGITQTIPVLHHGFSWEAEDFQTLAPVPQWGHSLIQRYYFCGGVGVPLVVERKRQHALPLEARFFPKTSSFATTAVLRFENKSTGPLSSTIEEESPVLEFYNPLAQRCIHSWGTSLPLAVDLTAPLTHALRDTPRTYMAGFVTPGQPETIAHLQFYEPYQPGKIPLVIIHGLFSDPQSWADMVNDLRASPGFANRYQIWVYRYPTGQGFLQSAATLRQELIAARQYLCPDGTDPAMDQMILVGHSMGGLISKLQVTYSDEHIWKRVANRPLEEILTTEVIRTRLAETCYFDPLPFVKRVVFIATPHCGSLRSSQLFGRGASQLVRPSQEQASMHEQLIQDNPDAFSPLIQRRFPTSIDLLSSRSPLLNAMRKMKVSDDVKLHSIIGIFTPVSLDGPSDGIVSVESATHPGCVSNLTVGAAHGQVHRNLKTSVEVLRILETHWQSTAIHVEEPAASLDSTPLRLAPSEEVTSSP